MTWYDPKLGERKDFDTNLESDNSYRHPKECRRCECEIDEDGICGCNPPEA